MANKFAVASNIYQTRYLRVECEQVSNGSSANSSTIYWTLSVVGGNTDFYTTGATKVIIGGNTVYSKARTSYKTGEFPASRGSVSGSLVIPHDNEGNLTIDVTLSTAIYTSTISEFTDTWTLDPIPRYATITHSVSSKDEISVNVRWSSDSIIDYLWYSKDGGSNWTGVDVADGSYGNYTVSGLSPNTWYNIKTRVRRKDSQLTTDSSILSVATYDYPFCTSTPNFTIGDPLTLTLYNPLARLVDVIFIGANGETLSTDSTAMESVTGYNSETFKNKLYNSIPNSNKGTYKISIIYGSSTKTTSTGSTYSVNISECSPTFEEFTYKDSNTAITNITENDQVLIKGKSTLQAIISPVNKMVAKKGASPSRYLGTIESNSANGNYSDTAEVILDLGTVDNYGTKRLKIKAYDTRNVYKEAHKDIVVYDYAKPTINVDVTRLNNFEETTTLKINGTYDKLAIDGTNKNSITAIEYRYQETGETWSDWATVKTTLNDGKFTCSDVSLALDNSKSFNIEVKATDKLDYNTASGSVDIGVALFFISTSDNKCYINDKQVMTGKAEDVNRTDLDIYTTEFVAGYGHNLTNSPLGGSNNLGHLISVPRFDKEGYVTQLFSPYTTDDLYIRKCDNGVWGTWKKINNDNSWTLLSSNTSTVSLTALNQNANITLNEDWQKYQEIMILIGQSINECTKVIIHPQIGERYKPFNLSALDSYQVYGYAGVGNSFGDPSNTLRCFCYPRECYGYGLTSIQIIKVYGRYKA